METTHYIPQALQKLPQWVVWKLENNKKLPYSVRYDGGARTTDISTLGSYAAAETKAKTRRYNGVGFVFFSGNRLVFIDLDHCFKADGTLTALARNIIEAFSRSYVEISQSGSGLHIITRGSIPKAIKTKEIEMYSDGRYCAMTFNSINPVEPSDQQAEIDTLYHWLEARRNKQRNKTSTVDCDIRSCISVNNSFLSANDVINKASHAKGGEAFLSLFNGEWQGLNIGDCTQSASDLAFANKLAFWCGCDASLMIEIFRQSGMYRNERKMNLAINRAIRDCGAIYNRMR
jgi:putative DNA primase/helicase